MSLRYKQPTAHPGSVVGPAPRGAGTGHQWWRPAVVSAAFARTRHSANRKSRWQWLGKAQVSRPKGSCKGVELEQTGGVKPRGKSPVGSARPRFEGRCVHRSIFAVETRVPDVHFLLAPHD